MALFPRISLLLLFIVPAFSLKLGVKHVYKYENNVQLMPNEERDEKRESRQFELQTDVHATVVWENLNTNEQLMKIELLQPTLWLHKKSTMKTHPSRIASSILFSHTVNGHVRTIFHNSNINSASKRTLAALAKLLSRSTKPLLTQHEDGCQFSSNAGDLEKLEKVCTYNLNEHKKTQYIRSALLQKEVHLEYHFASGKNDYQILECSEQIKMTGNLWKSDTFSLLSIIKLKFESEVSGGEVVDGKDITAAIETLKTASNVDLVEENLEHAQKLPEKKCDLLGSIKGYKKGLKTENLSKLTSANAFSKLLKCFRTASKEDIEAVLKNKDVSRFLPQLLDIVAFTGTKDSVDAAFETLDVLKSKDELLERYLLALSTSTSPTKEMVTVVLNQLEKINLDKKRAVSDEVAATFVNTLGALVKNLRSDNGANQQVLESVEKYFQSAIKTCTADECLLVNLRGLRNAAMATTVPLLLELSEKSAKIAHEALLALKRVGFHYSSPKCEKFAENIYYQRSRREDTSNRIVAAEMLMVCYSNQNTLKRFLSSLADQREHEMTTLIVSMIKEKMDTDSKFRLDVQNALMDSDVRQYYAVAQKGNSISFSNPLMSFLASSDSNATYNVHVELLSAGVMKQCFVDIRLNSPGKSVPLLSVGAVTEGLESVVSSSNSDNPDAVPSAAVDLSISGILLRPKVLFSGTSNLMGLVFSGAGSEKTPILQGNYLVIDVTKEVVLLSGLPVRLRIEGVASNDLSGSIQISLWSRNSQSEITNSIAMMLQASLAVDADFVLLKDELSVKTEASIEIYSNSEFYEEPYQMCVQLMHPDVILRTQRKISLSVPGSKILRTQLKKKKWTFPSGSYFLNKKNNNMCAAMAAAA